MQVRLIHVQLFKIVLKCVRLPINRTVKIITAKVRHNSLMFMITLNSLNNVDVYVVLYSSLFPRLF